MMYSEFIERTGFGESYITFSDYAKYIEPVYVSSSESKGEFCKRFYDLHCERVSDVVDKMIVGKDLGTKIAYLDGHHMVLSDVREANGKLKRLFLRTWNRPTPSMLDCAELYCENAELRARITEMGHRLDVFERDNVRLYGEIRKLVAATANAGADWMPF